MGKDQFFVKDRPARFANGFEPIEFSNRPFEVLTVSDKKNESWVTIAVEMPDGWIPEGKSKPAGHAVMSLPVSGIKMADGISPLKATDNAEKLEVVSKGILITCELDRSLTFTSTKAVPKVEAEAKE